jgi:hypothetical protein
LALLLPDTRVVSPGPDLELRKEVRTRPASTANFPFRGWSAVDMRQSQPPWECMGARCCGSGRRLTNGWQSSPFPHLAWKDINAPKASSPPNTALIDRHRRVGYVLYIYKRRAFRSLPGARSLAILITHASAFEQPDTLGANASAQSHGARPLARFAGLCWGQPIAGVFRQAWLRAQRHIPTWRPELSNANEQKAPEKKQRQKEINAARRLRLAPTGSSAGFRFRVQRELLGRTMRIKVHPSIGSDSTGDSTARPSSRSAVSFHFETGFCQIALAPSRLARARH